MTSPLDLEASLYSGQAFRWERIGGGWHRGLIEGRACRVRVRGDELVVVASPDLGPLRVRNYFRLDESHDRFLAEVPSDPYLRSALHAFPGLRLLRQPAWEMLVSFVISQNSNEAKIRATIEKLCALAGEEGTFEDIRFFRFPTPAGLARLSEGQLRSTGMGYRSRYVRAAADAVVAGRLDPDALARMRYEDAFDALMHIDGVGPKVADCILLYGCDHERAFPTDVWVRRFVRETYLRRARTPSHEAIRTFAWRHFGPHAGYAQHYLFHYRRAVGALAARPA